jgi:Holliday junction resolvase-like predicted endonuclease
MEVRTKKWKGAEGESLVDEWFFSTGWKPVIKNQRFRGGELDRLYVKSRVHRHDHVQLCLVEVKYAQISSASETSGLFEETVLKRFVKQNQMQNLYRFGELLATPTPRSGMGRLPKKVYLRLILVVKFQAHDGHRYGAPRVLEGLAKVCCWKDSYAILSLTPEYVARGMRTSLLQIEMPHHS